MIRIRHEQTSVSKIESESEFESVTQTLQEKKYTKMGKFAAMAASSVFR